MIIQRVGGYGGPVHVFPEEPFAKPIAGPFDTPAAARLWIVEQLEAALSEPKREVWGRVAAQLPTPSDFGLEITLIEMVGRGMPFEKIAPYIPHTRERRVHDRRMAAAGDLAL